MSVSDSNRTRATHGHSARDGVSVEYKTWKNIKARCQSGGEYYGGRGIKVCQRWMDSFEAFLADMGPRPSSEYSIDRYPDNDGNYEPDNCRWATKEQQMRNRRNTTTVEINGRVVPMRDAADSAGLPYSTVRYRIKRGWPAHRLFEPLNK